MRALVVFLLFLSLSACNLLGLDDTVPFADVANAERLGLPEPGTEVFQDAASWEAFWYDHTSASDSVGNPVLPPQIDFDTKTVVAVFLGGGPSGCSNYIRLVRSVSLNNDTAVVRIKRPGSVEGVCDMLISPIHVVEFEKAGSIRFVGDVPR